MLSENSTFNKKSIEEVIQAKPRNRKQLTNIKSSLAKKTKDPGEDEILSNISYLLNQPNDSLPWDPSMKNNPFFNKFYSEIKRNPRMIYF